jgi:hypothetical protein
VVVSGAGWADPLVNEVIGSVVQKSLPVQPLRANATVRPAAVANNLVLIPMTHPIWSNWSFVFRRALAVRYRRNVHPAR